MISSIRKKTSMLSAGLNLKPVTDLLWRLVSRRYYYLLTDFAPEITVKTGCFQQFPSEGSASCLFAFNMAWLTTRGVWTDIAITAKVSCSTWLVDDRMLDSHGRLNLQVTKKKNQDSYLLKTGIQSSLNESEMTIHWLLQQSGNRNRKPKLVSVFHPTFQLNWFPDG